MFSALTSYIWGTEEETCKPTEEIHADDQVELENEWIFIRPKDQAGNKRRHAHFIDDGASTASESADSAICGMEESWCVTPPQCFNSKRRRSKNAHMSPMENLLIEHPSMSIYQDNPDEETADDKPPTELGLQRQETHKPVAGRLQLLEQRKPLRDSNRKPEERKKSSPKNMKRKNMVHSRSHNTRTNKQYGRMTGKHVGMVGKRGT